MSYAHQSGADAAAALYKVATVRGPTKQYRRALQLLRNKEHLFHGTDSEGIRGILGQRELRQGTGSHGKGVYLWKDQPLLTFLNSPQKSGVALSKDQVGRFSQPADPNPGHAVRKHMLVHDGNVRLPEGKHTSVIAPAQDLRAMQGDLASSRNRQIDSSIFHQAEADWRAGHHAKSGLADISDVRKPNNVELARLRAAPVTYPKMRAAREDDVEAFLDAYRR